MYGSQDDVALSLREFRSGLMLTVPCADGSECLPFAAEHNCNGPKATCALAGDVT